MQHRTVGHNKPDPEMRRTRDAPREKMASWINLMLGLADPEKGVLHAGNARGAYAARTGWI